MKTWLKDLMTSILANILTPVLIFLLIAVAAVLGAGYVLFRDNLQTGLLLLLAMLVLLNTSGILYTIRQQRFALTSLNDSRHESAELAKAAKEEQASVLQRLDRFEEQQALFHETLDTLNKQHATILETINASNAGARQLVPKLSAEDSHRFDVKAKLPITNKVFDDTADPQRIHLEFTNSDGGDNIFHIRGIKYRGTSGEFGNQNLSSCYRIEGRYLIIPCEVKDLAPDQIIAINLELRNKWQAADMNRLAGNWGWLVFEVTFKGEALELPPYSL